MKYCLLNIITFLTLFGHSQTPDSIIKARRWQFGINYSADYTYRILKNNSGSESMESLIDFRNKVEDPLFGFTTGINSCFMFNKHLGIELGMHYSKKGYQITDIPVSTFDNPEGDTKADIFYNYHYLDIPLRTNFVLGKKKLQFIGSAGFTANIFLKEINQSVIHFSDHDEEHRSEPGYDYKPLNLSANISTGISYRFTDRMTIRIEPTLRCGLTGISDTPVTARFFNAGLNVGYYMSF